MRRSPLPRRTPLRRSSRVRARRAQERRRSDAPLDPDYLAWVDTLPCCACGTRQDVSHHHAGRRPGAGMKAPDRTAIPMCGRCHIDEWHPGHGFCEGWNKAQRRAWQDARIAETRERYRRETGIDVTAQEAA